MNTDPDGWQYRSEWPRAVLTEADEPWSAMPLESQQSTARRRLWMTTVVMRDDVLAAKRKISDTIQAHQRGVILGGPLLRLEDSGPADQRV